MSRIATRANEVRCGHTGAPAHVRPCALCFRPGNRMTGESCLGGQCQGRAGACRSRVLRRDGPLTWASCVYPEKKVRRSPLGSAVPFSSPPRLPGGPRITREHQGLGFVDQCIGA